MAMTIGGKTPQTIEIGGKAVQSLAIGGEVVWSAAPQIPDYMRLKNISNESGVFKMVKKGSPTTPNLEYSLDGDTWATYDFTTLPEVTVSAGANIYFRGTNANGQFNSDGFNYVIFSFNKTCEGHGNMCSLLDPDPSVFTTITSIGRYGLYSLFKDCTSLTVAPDLSNVTTVGNVGIGSCFRGCNSLTTPPDFSNVTTVGESGIGSCFYGCTSLTTPPDLSNVTSIGNYGLYSCFQGCTSLTVAPDLSNLTSVSYNGLQSCFYGCTSLTVAPDLSNLTSVRDSAFTSCFGNCTSLTTGPDLSNLTSVGQVVLQTCFQGCSKLGDVTTPNISDLTANNVLRNWLNNAGTQATGNKVVRVPSVATIAIDDVSGIPSGWTRVDY